MMFWTLIVFGTALMLFELFLPGGISFCVGLSTLVLAAVIHYQWIQNPFDLFLTWSFLSVFTSSIGIMVSRFFFGGKRDIEHFDEDLDMVGKLVEVIEEITPNSGRIIHAGCTWEARSKKEHILKGTRAKVLARENITYIVESE